MPYGNSTSKDLTCLAAPAFKTTTLATVALTAMTLTAIVSADQITLTNGDIIQGQLSEQTESQVTWDSERFGALTIALEQVASINGESIGQKPPEVFNNTYNGSLSLTGAYASGNQEREDLDFDSNVEWRDGDFRHLSSINYETHSLDGSPENQEYALNYGVNWFFQEQWFWSNGIEFGASEERAIDQYYAVGSAIGRQFWDSDSSALSAETGLLWISEELEDQTTDKRLTWSWATDYRTLLMQNMELFHSHKILIALTDISDSDFKADLGIKVPVIENLFTELKLEWIYDNQPAAGTEKSDSQLTIGVNYSW